MIKFEKVSYNEFKKACLKTYGCIEESTIKDLYDKIELPTRSTKHSAGYDFKFPLSECFIGKSPVMFPTGIKCQMDEDVVLTLYPRSSLGFKYGMELLNTVGIIDSDYYGNPDNEGHIMAKFRCTEKPKILENGEAFMQGIFIHYLCINGEKSIKNERVGGIGSTNN